MKVLQKASLVEELKSRYSLIEQDKPLYDTYLEIFCPPAYVIPRIPRNLVFCIPDCSFAGLGLQN